MYKNPLETSIFKTLAFVVLQSSKHAAIFKYQILNPDWLIVMAWFPAAASGSILCEPRLGEIVCKYLHLHIPFVRGFFSKIHRLKNTFCNGSLITQEYVQGCIVLYTYTSILGVL